jgi:putative pyruvate formate lyase activating enzyme
MKSFVVEPQPPGYLSLSGSQWEEKTEKSRELMSQCVLCGRRCKAQRAPVELRSSESRAEGEQAGCSRDHATGVCRTGDRAKVSSFGPHFGEEPPLVGRRGSGTIFFAGCNLKCIYCQNYDIAHLDRGWEITDEELSRIMLRLQELGCHNINLVSPTHVVPNILAAVRLAAVKGLKVPIVYNTGGYDSLETLEILDGVVDIYMPDMKYGEPGPAEEFSMAPDYPEVNFRAVKEMHRQVGDLVTDKHGVAVRGLLVRHLVLPGDMAGTEKVMEFIAAHISKDTYVNIMDQYWPCYKARRHPVIGRRISGREYRDALDIARRAGLTRVQVL